MKKYCGPLELFQGRTATSDEIAQLEKAKRKFAQRTILFGCLFLLILVGAPVFFELAGKHISLYFMHPIAWIAGFALFATPKRILGGAKRSQLVRKSL